MTDSDSLTSSFLDEDLIKIGLGQLQMLPSFDDTSASDITLHRGATTAQTEAKEGCMALQVNSNVESEQAHPFPTHSYRHGGSLTPVMLLGLVHGEEGDEEAAPSENKNSALFICVKCRIGFVSNLLHYTHWCDNTSGAVSGDASDKVAEVVSLGQTMQASFLQQPTAGKKQSSMPVAGAPNTTHNRAGLAGQHGVNPDRGHASDTCKIERHIHTPVPRQGRTRVRSPAGRQRPAAAPPVEHLENQCAARPGCALPDLRVRQSVSVTDSGTPPSGAEKPVGSGDCKERKTPLHFCTKCAVCYSSETKLYMHEEFHNKMTKNKKEKPYTCEPCQMYFRRRVERENHRRQQHPSQGGGLCKVCPKCEARIYFSRKAEYMSHISSHETYESGVKKKFMCIRCSTFYVTPNEFIIHLGAHHSEGGTREKVEGAMQALEYYERSDDEMWHICTTCRAFSSTRAKVIAHQAQHRAYDENNVQKPYACAPCGVYFTSDAELLDHQAAHRGSNQGRFFVRPTPMASSQNSRMSGEDGGVLVMEMDDNKGRRGPVDAAERRTPVPRPLKRHAARPTSSSSSSRSIDGVVPWKRRQIERHAGALVTGSARRQRGLQTRSGSDRRRMRMSISRYPNRCPLCYVQLPNNRDVLAHVKGCKKSVFYP